eukprot:gene23064-30253_t
MGYGEEDGTVADPVGRKRRRQQRRKRKNRTRMAKKKKAANPEDESNDDDGESKSNADSDDEDDTKFDADVGILITGCMEAECSADARPHDAPPCGAMTNALVSVVRTHVAANPDTPLTYRNLVIAVRDLLCKTHFPQNLSLECSDRWADSPFIVQA